MGVGIPKLKVPSICLLLLIMSIFLLPGSQGETCKELSQTYTTPNCATEPCVKYCILEGFDGGECQGSYFQPLQLLCFCERPC